MCAIIGYSPRATGLELRDRVELFEQFRRLARECMARGTHAFGLARWAHGAIHVTKSQDIDDVLLDFEPSEPCIFHARYSTSGDWREPRNNQPLVVGHHALAFNGVIHMGTKAEMEEAFAVQLASENDGEVFIRRVLGGETPEHFIQTMTGSFAGVWIHEGRLHAGRNERRPLWRTTRVGETWYASTADIFRRAGIHDVVEMYPGVEKPL